MKTTEFVLWAVLCNSSVTRPHAASLGAAFTCQGPRNDDTNPASDRHAKEDLSAVDPTDMLEKVAALPSSKWNAKGEAATSPIGPTAQDDSALFTLSGRGLDPPPNLSASTTDSPLERNHL